MYVGVGELKEIGINIYPNPSASGLYFVRTSADVTQMEVLSVNGRRLQTTIENNIVDLRNQPPGVYVLTIVSEGISYAVKLMKH
jgi:precorrin-6B methylase 1